MVRSPSSDRSPSPLSQANRPSSRSKGTIWISVFSMMHSGLPLPSVTTLRSPGFGIPLPLASYSHLREPVAVLTPRRTRSAISRADAFEPKWNTQSYLRGRRLGSASTNWAQYRSTLLRVTRPLPPAFLQALLRRKLADLDPFHREAKALRDLRDHGGVVEMVDPLSRSCLTAPPP